MATHVSQTDRIIDNATQAAISAAEADFPSYVPSEIIQQTGSRLMHFALIEFDPEDIVAFTQLYLGVFVAAYGIRMRALTLAPSSSAHHHGL